MCGNLYVTYTVGPSLSGRIAPLKIHQIYQVLDIPEYIMYNSVKVNQHEVLDILGCLDKPGVRLTKCDCISQIDVRLLFVLL